MALRAFKLNIHENLDDLSIYNWTIHGFFPFSEKIVISWRVIFLSQKRGNSDVIRPLLEYLLKSEGIIDAEFFDRFTYFEFLFQIIWNLGVPELGPPHYVIFKVLFHSLVGLILLLVPFIFEFGSIFIILIFSSWEDQVGLGMIQSTHVWLLIRKNVNSRSFCFISFFLRKLEINRIG